MPRNMYTTPGGPLIIGHRSLRGLIVAKKDQLLPSIHPNIFISKSNFSTLNDCLATAPDWLQVADDFPGQTLPARLSKIPQLDADSLKLALHHKASLLMLEQPAKDLARLSYFKCEGALAFAVYAFRQNLLKDVRPIVKIWQKMGFSDLLPEQQMLDALFDALDELS